MKKKLKLKQKPVSWTYFVFLYQLSPFAVVTMFMNKAYIAMAIVMVAVAIVIKDKGN